MTDTPAWRKSTHSTSGACVEVAPLTDTILIRDSKDPTGPILTIPPTAFAAFVKAVTHDEFGPTT